MNGWNVTREDGGFLLFSLLCGVVVMHNRHAVNTAYERMTIFEEDEKDQMVTSQPLPSNAYSHLIGNTPLVELTALSRVLGGGKRLFAKMENLNPGGTGKDRAAKFMIQEAYDRLQRCKVAVEGTSGSTGIALAYLCKSYGIQLHVFLPDDQAQEKKYLLEKLGVKVTVQKCCSISNRDHYVNVAKRYALEHNVVFMDQFENLANYKAHYTTTGPEIWKQTNGEINCFVMSAGTGGTIAGVSNYLKKQHGGENIKIVLADPPGSSLFNRIQHGICYTSEQRESKMKKHRYDTIAEGIGLDRITANFEKAKIDVAIRVEDQEAVDMAHWLLANEGMFVGSSSAMNIVAACRIAIDLPDNSTIVTVICDNGKSHLSRFWNEEYVTSQYQLKWPHHGNSIIPACLYNIHHRLPRLRGRCKCKKVRYKVYETEKQKIWGGCNCHCQMCPTKDKTHHDEKLGKGMRFIAVPEGGLEYDEFISEENVVYTRTSSFARRARSKCCDTPLYMKYDCENHSIWVTVDSLEHGDHEFEALKIRYHIHSPMAKEVPIGSDGALVFPTEDLSWWIIDPCRSEDALPPDVCFECMQLLPAKCTCSQDSKVQQQLKLEAQNSVNINSGMKTKISAENKTKVSVGTEGTNLFETPLKIRVPSEIDDNGSDGNLSSVDAPPHLSPHASKYLDKEFLDLLKNTHEHVLTTARSPRNAGKSGSTAIN